MNGEGKGEDVSTAESEKGICGRLIMGAKAG